MGHVPTQSGHERVAFAAMHGRDFCICRLMALSDRAVSFDLWSAFGAIQTWAWAGTIGLSRFLQRDLSVPCGTVRLTRSIHPFHNLSFCELDETAFQLNQSFV
jgi:hypothetical protein